MIAARALPSARTDFSAIAWVRSAFAMTDWISVWSKGLVM